MYSGPAAPADDSPTPEARLQPLPPPSVGPSPVVTDTTSLDRSLIHGVAWTGAAKWISQMVAWVGTIVVARLLSPADYGLVGMATVYLGLTAIVTEFGLGTAIIAQQHIDRRQVAQLNSVALCIGIAAFALSCLVAVPLSMFFRTPELRWVVIVLSTTFIVDALRTVPSALLTRELKFKTLALLEGYKAFFVVALTIGLAVAGMGPWALVGGNLGGAVFLTGLLLARHAAPFAIPRLAIVRSTLVVSTQLLVERVSWYAYSNSDFLVAGRLLGQSALGSYSYAWTLASMPGEKIMSLFWRVTPAVFSAAKSDLAALRRYLLIMTEALALILLPATIGLALVAPEFVRLFLGDQWLGAIVPLRLLTIYASMHMISTLLPHVLIVTQQVTFATKLALCALATLPPAFYLFGTLWGTAGIAAAWLVVYPFILFALGRRVLGTLHLSAVEYFRSLWPALSGSLAMTVTVLTTRAVLPESWPLALRFALAVGVGMLTYPAVVLLAHRARVQALLTFLRGARV